VRLEWIFTRCCFSRLNSYIQLACEAFFPPLIHNGVAFEAHGQNVLLRIDIRSKKILGFIVRDLGGLRIHPPTLARSTGVDFEFLPDHCVATRSLAEAYPKLYHTLVHNHLQRLIRLLDMHHDGSGYALVRKHFEAAIPADHELRKLWLVNKTVPGKCLMRMKLQGVYRDVSRVISHMTIC
jgi:siderophore synthetase component